MGPREVAARVRDELLKTVWRRLKARPIAGMPELRPNFREIAVSEEGLGGGPTHQAVLAFAERLLSGRLPLFGG